MCIYIARNEKNMTLWDNKKILIVGSENYMSESVSESYVGSEKADTVGNFRQSKKADTVGNFRQSEKADTVGKFRQSEKLTVGKSRHSRKKPTQTIN